MFLGRDIARPYFSEETALPLTMRSASWLMGLTFRAKSGLVNNRLGSMSRWLACGEKKP